jgi:hypothetical protein
MMKEKLAESFGMSLTLFISFQSKKKQLPQLNIPSDGKR